MTKGNILVVEDESITALDLRNRLESMGFEVPAIASSGEEAIEYASENKPDLVLMDIVLKGELDGIEAAEQIRNDFDIPVVYLTAYADDLTLHRAKVTDPFGYIIKPYEERELYTTVQMALNKHKLEIQLKVGEEKYRNLISNLTDAVMEIDIDGKFTYVSPQTFDILGFTPEDCLDKNTLEFIHPDDKEKYLDLLENSVENDQVFSFEYRIQHNNGHYVPVSVSGKFIPPQNGKLKMVAVVRDITKRKQAEEALRESEEKYRRLIDNLSDIVLELDSDGNFVYVSPQVKDIFGYEPEEVIKKSVFEFIHPEDIEKTMDTMAALLKSKGKDKVPFEYRLKHKDGYYVPVFSSGKIIGEGQDKRLIAIIRDISERKLAEEAIRESEEKFRSISATAQDAIIMVNINGDVTYWNPAAEKIFGYTSTEIRDKNLHDVILPAPNHETYKKEINKIFKPGQKPASGKTLEMFGLKKDDTKFPIELSMSAVKIKGKWKAVSIIRDISDRKRIEKQITRSLKEKKVMLQEIHHRVKNNMQIISSLLKLQAGSIKDNKTVELFNDSQNRIKSMALVHEKLYRSKDLATINFNDYIQSMVNGLFRSYKTSIHKVKLVTEIQDVVLGIDYAIPCGLIINELISNTLKYAFPEGKEGVLKISLRSIKNNSYELVVSDNGVGIPDNLDFRTTESLGLHLVNLLVEDQLEGELELDRTNGSKFTIRFKGVK